MHIWMFFSAKVQTYLYILLVNKHLNPSYYYGSQRVKKKKNIIIFFKIMEKKKNLNKYSNL